MAKQLGIRSPVNAIRQLVSFVLGVAVGVCLYSLLKLRPLSVVFLSSDSTLTGARHPGASLRPNCVQRAVPLQASAPARARSEKAIKPVAHKIVWQQTPRGVKVAALKTDEPKPTQGVVGSGILPSPAPLLAFETVGYVEHAGGQVEAIILQENQIHVVHTGDLIAGRYRVTMVSPDTVNAVDETLAYSPMANPDNRVSSELTASAVQQTSAPLANRTSAPQEPNAVGNSLGYVQEVDGMTEAIVAEGDSIRLIPQHPDVSLAQETYSDKPPAPVSMKPIGSVVQSDGELAAILSVGDKVEIVRQGDRFAGHFRAVSVSANAVEAVEDTPTWATPAPPVYPRTPTDILSVSQEQVRTPFSGSDDLHGKDQGHDRQATFVFQTIGYVEARAAESRQAIVADGANVYLVQQGEIFADQYRATNVGPVLVLAVKVIPEQHAGSLLSAQTDSGGKAASNNLYGSLRFPLFTWAMTQAPAGASGSPFLTDLGMNLLNSSLTGF